MISIRSAGFQPALRAVSRLNVRARLRPSLRTVLLLSNLAVLALPVVGLWALRLYESALVRQTESELVAQAAVLAGALRAQLQIVPPPEPGAPAPPAAAAMTLARRPGLDFATDPIGPPPPDAVPAGAPDPALARAGQALTPVLRDAQAVTLASLRLTDRTGIIVATTGGDVGLSLAAWPEAAQVLAGAPVAAGMHHREPAKAVPGGISRTAAIRVFVALPVLDAGGAVIGAVVLSRTPNSLGAAIWGKAPALAALLVTLLAGGTLLAAAISRLVTRPLAAVVAQADAVAASGAMTLLPHPGTREVAALSAALARMASTLETRAGYISGFAASVSHEFKTPLAAIRAAAELLEEPDLSEAERAQLLRKVTDGTARLDHLVARLVELARADMMRAVPADGRTPVAPLLARLADKFRAEGADITAAPVPGTAGISEDALCAVLTALIENAVLHAPGAAIHLAGEATPDRIRLTVTDDGPGIPEANRPHIFEPFFTTARPQGGTGLGLPIARALLAGVGGDVTLLIADHRTVAAVDLPVNGRDAAESQ